MTIKPGQETSKVGAALKKKFEAAKQAAKCLSLTASLLMLTTALHADLIPIDPLDPETVHVGTGVGTTCATGDAMGCQIWNGEVNGIKTPNTLSLYMNGAGQGGQLNPILLIVGIPNVGAGAVLPAITNISLYENYPQTGIPSNPPQTSISWTAQLGGTSGAAAWGGVWNAATGYAGSLTGTNQGSNTAYQIANLNAGGSESFVNWSGADSAINGINATSFGIYVYKLNVTPAGSWSGSDLLNISFGGNGLAKGDFIVSYSCAVAGSTCASKNTYSVPFTQAGLETLPEPSTFVLLGSGLLMGLRKFRTRL